MQNAAQNKAVDELQQAIDSIAEAGNERKSSENYQNQGLAEPVMPTVASAPTITSTSIPTPPVMPTPVTSQDQNIVETGAKPEPKTPAVHKAHNLDDLKIKAITELKDLVEKVDLLPEDKFMVYREVIEASRDASYLPAAYASAQKIADDNMRARALLFVVDAIDELR